MRSLTGLFFLIKSVMSCVCPPEELKSFLASEAYISLARQSLIPDYEYEILVSGDPWDLVESVLAGTYTTTTSTTAETTDDGELTVAVAMQRRNVAVIIDGYIPGDDHIAFESIGDLKKLLREIDSSDEINQNVNVALFTLSTETDQISECESVYCRRWRTVLRQTSLRVSIALADGNFDMPKTRAVIEGLVSARILGTPQQFAGLAAIAIAAVAPVVIERTARGIFWCITECYNRRTTSTTTTTPTTTDPPTTALSKDAKMRSTFFLTTNTYIDEAAQLIASVNAGSSSPERIKEITGTVSALLVKTVTIVSKLTYMSYLDQVFDPTTCINRAFEVVHLLEHAQVDSWQSTASQSFVLLNEIRSELLKFALAA